MNKKQTDKIGDQISDGLLGAGESLKRTHFSPLLIPTIIILGAILLMHGFHVNNPVFEFYAGVVIIVVCILWKLVRLFRDRM